MPGRHAPPTPTSFYLSLARSAAGALGVLGLVVLAVLLVVNRGGGATALPTPGATQSPTVRSTAARTTPAPTGSPTATRALRPPSQTTVNVLNGTTRAGLARSVADDLEETGYIVRTVGNAASTTQTTVYHRPGAEAEARDLVRRHPELKRVAPASSSTPTNALLTVVLGQDFSPSG